MSLHCSTSFYFVLNKAQPPGQTGFDERTLGKKLKRLS